ncbi:sulfite exporter TauE/SafE family protein [Lentibacillus persicus]|uniref:sulfite exporter TauE/SafE family protein n=1 Tax=Lentibacillus persicus TaxID=640948 RepID=UPI000B7F023D|nr:sulfite exporter TauE/SafE family protein [Lentibacillus persicus]
MAFTTGLIILVLGIVAGGYGTIVGAGGGFIFVPALLIILNMDPVVAASSGLFIVLINALSGVTGYAIKRKINYKIGLLTASGAIPGSLIGVWILQRFSSQVFYLIFATILTLLGIYLFFKNVLPCSDKYVQNQPGKRESFPSIKWLPLFGVFLGVLSSYMGIGGGWLLVPVLIYVFRLSPHQSAATSIFSLAIYTSIGVAAQLFYNNIDWLTVLWGGAGVILGSQIGVILSQKLPGKLIVQMLSFLLIIIGVRLYFQ